MNPINYFLWIVGIVVGLLFSPTAAAIPESSVSPAPVYKCDDLTVIQIDRTTFRFIVSAAAENDAQIVSYTYNLGNGTTATTAGTTIDHTYAQPGSYTVTATVNVRVNGEVKPGTSSNCEVTIKVEEPSVRRAINEKEFYTTYEQQLCHGDRTIRSGIRKAEEIRLIMPVGNGLFVTAEGVSWGECLPSLDGPDLYVTFCQPSIIGTHVSWAYIDGNPVLDNNGMPIVHLLDVGDAPCDDDALVIAEDDWYAQCMRGAPVALAIENALPMRCDANPFKVTTP